MTAIIIGIALALFGVALIADGLRRGRRRGVGAFVLMFIGCVLLIAGAQVLLG